MLWRRGRGCWLKRCTALGTDDGQDAGTRAVQEPPERGLARLLLFLGWQSEVDVETWETTLAPSGPLSMAPFGDGTPGLQLQLAPQVGAHVGPRRRRSHSSCFVLFGGDGRLS